MAPPALGQRMLRTCLQFVPSSLRRSSQASSSVSAISHTLIYSWSPVLGLRMSCVRYMSFSICERSLSCSTGWAIAGKLYVVWQLPVWRDVLQGIHYMVKQMPVFWGRLFFDFVVKQLPVFWAVFFEWQAFTFTQQSTCFQRWTEFSFKLLYPSNKVGGVYWNHQVHVCICLCVWACKFCDQGCLVNTPERLIMCLWFYDLVNIYRREGNENDGSDTLTKSITWHTMGGLFCCALQQSLFHA